MIEDKWTKEELEHYQTQRNNTKVGEPPLIKCIQCGSSMINACRIPCPNCGYQMECS